jgi:hypothetical protein
MGQAVSPEKLLRFGSLHFARPPVERNGKHLEFKARLKSAKSKLIYNPNWSQHLRNRSAFSLPAEELACIYLDRDNKPVTRNPSSADFPKLKHQSYAELP